MQKFSLDARVREHMQRAAETASGRSAQTVYGGHEHVLRQTLVALEAGESLTEHENPGEATLLVLRGRVRLQCAEASWDGVTGDMIIVPPARHSLEALERSAILLTVATHPVNSASVQPA
ncbi:cupin domain-containing protein (plasmid) [Embleya sp. NBC_00888]|uniref:cupin domain-containing protein n=1 Tax=Embleya sp. NBC_00888 TaxID=2975960 RepID=UPI002F90919B|nr:cupin domain-containing protein [Embleya sp. NBC_00888]